MTKKISITLLFTIVFALTFVTLFGNSQVRAADCDSALVPSTMTIQTSEDTIRVTVDPCTGELLLVEFCDTDLTNCTVGKLVEAAWCIEGSTLGCRPYSTVLPTSNALPGAYSNARYYYTSTAISR